MMIIESEQSTDHAFAALFRAAGWEVVAAPAQALRYQPDLLLRKGKVSYVADVKAASESRADRVIALLAQAILQAQAYARAHGRARPLALIWVRELQGALLRRIGEFCANYAADVAVGVASPGGTRYFRGAGLEPMSTDQPISTPRRVASARIRGGANLFSDLNQWLLKVLFAPQVPAAMLTAPRAGYRTISELAKAADVSVMTASRFVAAMHEQGFLDEGGELRVVRRRELAERWKSYYRSTTPEARMRFVMPGDPRARIAGWLGEHEGCVGLFGAADALGVGHVHGVPPYLYVRDLEQAANWPGLAPASADAERLVILKQASAPNSLLRGSVRRQGLVVADVIQVWLDTVSHPSRGTEQSLHIENTVLRDLVGDTS
ncbi:RpiR family transcriptional regulator [Burkholderia gladioli]|nr:RpiR family transcriptional regulator [Burkholderia gladioli]ATF89207.1 RpiR family transcriptional regulator [Burkholderia gladioli pv. gladioli]MBJ9659412.1 RpiR family transcriptional regulator [Burkholderia gladioli]MBU9156921.1 RpiR family transcriptional regulator [Burkholderia gladioli]MBU9167621.1 RpiR family transcriptional regulator [Burkholderia gladioli]MBU9199119.1 RpiR family transcriptional regulator [Burkholderia gladioli]